MALRTRSIRQLTVAGFLLVAALLIVALLINARQLDQLTDSSQLVISQSAQMLRASRQLIEHGGAMERNARQYLVLGDAALLEVYSTRREEFRAALERLSALSEDHNVLAQIEALHSSEAEAYAALQLASGRDLALSDYPPLLEPAYELSRLTSGWLDEQVASLREQTRDTQQTLNLQTVLLVVAALAVATLAVALITHPLRQIDQAINSLGRGTYEGEIRIEGPRDLQLLGQRLDWLRSRLNQLEQQRSAFLRHVSHELKTPLAAMQESAALLSDEVTGQLNPAQREVLTILSNNCQRLLHLIEDLLRHHDSSFGALETMPQPVSLHQLIENIIQAHQLAIRSAQLQVQSQLERVVAAGDAEHMRVVIDNLVSNAIKYSPRGGPLQITLRQDKSDAIVQIQDHGPGVAENDRNNIFTAFYQGASPGRSHYKGTGLGLAIAREYAEAGGGSVSLLSSAEGARFEARFPLQRNAPAANRAVMEEAHAR